MIRPLAAIGAFAFAVLAIATESPAAPPAPSVPFEAELTRALGFRTDPGLAAPFVISGRNYLQPPARFRVVGTTGVLGAANTFCKIEHAGKQGYLRCDDLTAFKVIPAARPTTPPASGGMCRAQERMNGAGLKLCTDEKSCAAFCSCACDFDATKWRPSGQPEDTTSCPMDRANYRGAGMLAADSPDLTVVRDMPYVNMVGTVRASKKVAEALQRLNDHLARSPDRAARGYRAQVQSCWRDARENTTSSCSHILKALHMMKKLEGKPERAEWEERLNVQKLGLGWPGAGAHTTGMGCDIVLIDSAGKMCFDERVGKGAPSCSIPQREASRILDEAVTSATVGGRRLNYEAWHFEWNDNTDCRCKAPQCANDFWPPLADNKCGKR
jgi:hypothetical protein